MNIGEVVSALALCASSFDDDKDHLLMLRDIYSIEDKGDHIEVYFVDRNTDSIRIYPDGKVKKLFCEEGVATTLVTESDGNTYAYATVDGIKYRYFVWSDPSQAEGLPMANTPENKDRFEKWIKEEWEPIH